MRTAMLVAVPEPPRLMAVTWQVSDVPASVVVVLYVAPVAPAIGRPLRSQT